MKAGSIIKEIQRMIDCGNIDEDSELFISLTNVASDNNYKLSSISLTNENIKTKTNNVAIGLFKNNL